VDNGVALFTKLCEAAVTKRGELRGQERY